MANKKKIPLEQWQRINQIRCDLCSAIAIWEHPMGGLRCNYCPRPDLAPVRDPFGEWIENNRAEYNKYAGKRVLIHYELGIIAWGEDLKECKDNFKHWLVVNGFDEDDLRDEVCYDSVHPLANQY